MDLDAVMGLCRTQAHSLQTLAALGAALRVHGEKLEADPRIAVLLHDIAGLVLPGALADLDEGGLVIAQSYVRTMLRQALDLAEHPDRSPGWHCDDPALLDSQGRSSRFAVHRIEGFARAHPGLARALRRAGTFLDIGTGAGWLAIEVALRFPRCRVVGVDPWRPALSLARRNVEASGLSDRIVLRQQGVTDIRDTGSYDIIWLPGPFIAEDMVRRSLPALLQALSPGGALVFGLLALPGEPLAARLAELHIVRNGGEAWTAEAVAGLLEAAGFVEIGHAPGDPLVLVVACRPAEGP